MIMGMRSQRPMTSGSMPMRALRLLLVVASIAAVGARTCDVVEQCHCSNKGSNASQVQTTCLQHCINTCGRDGPSGSANITFPPGVFHTGSLTLPSRTTLHLGAGATILGSMEPADYPLVPALPSYGVSRDCCCNDWLKYNCSGGNGAQRHMSLISSSKADHVAIEVCVNKPNDEIRVVFFEILC